LHQSGLPIYLVILKKVHPSAVLRVTITGTNNIGADDRNFNISSSLGGGRDVYFSKKSIQMKNYGLNNEVYFNYFKIKRNS